MDDWFLHYGMDRDPFVEGGVLGLFYPGGGRQEAVEQLQHLARFGDCVLLLGGGAGAGKSSVLRQVQAQGGPDVERCIVEAQVMEDAAQLLQRILRGFGVAAAGASVEDGLQALDACCADAVARGRLCWLLVDDAQHLAEDGLRLLARLPAATHGRLHLVLAAEPGFGETLRAALPGELKPHEIALAPLDAGETYAYVHYRLKTAGLEADSPLTGEEIGLIHRQSGGLPGRINQAARTLLVANVGVVREPLSRLPVWHLGVVAATLVALLLMYLWNAQEEPVPVPRANTGAPPALDAGAEETAGAADLAEDAGIEPAAEPAPQEAPPSTPAPAPAADAPAVAGPATASPRPVAAAGERAAPAEEPDDDLPAATIDIVPPAREPPATVAAAPAAAGAVDPPAAAPQATGDEAALLAADPGHYTLQLMATDNAGDARRFLAAHPIGLQLHRKTVKGRVLYAVVHGDFPTRAAAESALRGLDGAVAAARPWIRRLDAVQAEIRRAQQRPASKGKQ